MVNHSGVRSTGANADRAAGEPVDLFPDSHVGENASRGENVVEVGPAGMDARRSWTESRRGTGDPVEESYTERLQRVPGSAPGAAGRPQPT